MIDQQLFSQVKDPPVVRAALVGCGSFGASIVTQARLIPRLEIRIVADIDPAAARRAFQQAGVSEDDIAICSNASRALWAMEAGKWVIVEDAMLLMGLPLHVIVTATRVPEAGVRHAYEAIRHGKHVVMVDKEADATCGAILKYLADRAGVVYTAEDGDQPGLALGLIAWAEALGFEVLCGGYLHEWAYDAASGTLSSHGSQITVPPGDRWAFDPIPPGEVRRYTEVRDRVTADWQAEDDFGDTMAHLAVIANGSRLMSENPSAHRTPLRVTELASVFCPEADGGILHTRNAVALPNILRTGESPSVDGGVFIVMTTSDPQARHVMAVKGTLTNRDRSAFLIYRPHHLCGAETAMSILVAGLLRAPTGSHRIVPSVDVAATVTRGFRVGEMVCAAGKSCWSRDLRASLVPAATPEPDAPLPYYLLEGNRLTVDVPQGTLITRRMVEPPPDSILWTLRQKQDELFPAQPDRTN
ncbi:hypothetical protein FJZ36_03695 [Candidatus Poribacteria bacterium]|nr:hypothetical protein [Candidatus Poribacteria bacterium]